MKNNNQFVFEYNTKTNSYTVTLGAVESKITEILFRDTEAYWTDLTVSCLLHRQFFTA